MVNIIVISGSTSFLSSCSTISSSCGISCRISSSTGIIITIMNISSSSITGIMSISNSWGGSSNRRSCNSSSISIIIMTRCSCFLRISGLIQINSLYILKHFYTSLTFILN